MSAYFGAGINSLGEFFPFLVLHLSLNARRVHRARIDVCSTLTSVTGWKSIQNFTFSIQAESDEHSEPK